ncbi:MAG: ATPase, T2SS/T4P/T4SS family [Desulfobacterales bacterium]|nr:ATPase, T2SS/T4P/T4SS family [Desulfobacterales bacterium]
MTKKDTAKDTPPTDMDFPESGDIVRALIEEGYITEEQAQYARRIQAKLPTQKTVLEVFKELKQVTDQQIRDAIHDHRVQLRIGRMLVELGRLTEGDLKAALSIKAKEKANKKLGEILVEHNFIDERKLIEVLSMQMGFEYIDPQFTKIDSELYRKVPHKWYEDHRLIPIRREGDKIIVAFADPLDKHELAEARKFFGQNIRPAIALKTSIQEALKQMERSSRMVNKAEVAHDTVVGIVNNIIITAVNEDVSDIHIEPMNDRLRVRFRQDGVLVQYKDYERELILPLASRLKIMCGADIAEKRRHQGGRILFDIADTQVDLRVSFYVTINGEKIVMRLLKQQATLLNIEDVGISPRIFERFQYQALDRPSGVLMVTGPTGSGKTTTVYSCINYLNSPTTSIITAEDPVEYIIDGIAQCSINPKLDLTFEETLRHIVRQDPDVVVIGEIRDKFSADVAVNAALTGHKVLTTFHTEDSIGALIRLLNMGIEAFLVAATVVGVVAQRLVRRPCKACAEPETPSLAALRRLGYSAKDVLGGEFQKGKGCPECRFTGYKGRAAILEILIMDEFLRNAVIDRQSTYQLRQMSIEKSGLVTLIEDGILKAARGITTLDEVLRCLPQVIRPRPLAELRRISGEKI